MHVENSFSEPGDNVPPYSAINQDVDSSSMSLYQSTEADARSYDQVSKVKVKKTHDQGSEGESRSQVTSTTGPEGSDSKFSHACNKDILAEVENSGQEQKGFMGSTDLSHMMSGNDIDQTATVLNAFSLGKPSVRKNDSGMAHILL